MSGDVHIMSVPCSHMSGDVHIMSIPCSHMSGNVHIMSGDVHIMSVPCAHFHSSNDTFHLGKCFYFVITLSQFSSCPYTFHHLY